MAAAYIFATVTIIALHLDQLLPALKAVFSGAFTGTAAMGGFAGATVKMAIQKGVARGVFSMNLSWICTHCSRRSEDQ